MSHAFETFLKQYHMTGSEKADGYSQDAFLGLSEEEKNTVFEMLTKEIPWSAEWLFFLNSAKAMQVCKEMELELRNQKYSNAYMLQEQMVKHSGDLVYQEHMIEDFQSYDESVKPRVVDAISRTPFNEATVAFFKTIIMTEVNGSAVARASRHLLNGLGVPRSTEAEEDYYKLFISELRSNNVKDKLNAFQKISHYEKEP